MPRRLICLFLVIVILSTLSVTFSFADTSGEWTYTILYEEYIWLNGYSGSGGAVTVPSSLNGYPVQGIENTTFKNNTALTSVTIPDSVTYIQNESFQGCTNLTSVSLSNSITSIQDATFLGCTKLTSIVLPEGVLGAYNNAFAGCTSLTSVTLPSTLVSLTSGTFSNCTALTSITLPANLANLGSDIFQGSGLTSITIPSKVNAIGDNAFGFCNSLTTVNISEGVKTIKYYAFQFSPNITSITIPNSVTSIQQDAFRNCTNLATIEFLNKDTVIDMHSSTIPVATRLIGHDPSSAKTYATTFSRSFEAFVVPPPPNTAVTSISGDLTPTIVQFTVPAITSFAINPNGTSPVEQFIAPTFNIRNDSVAPIKVTLKSFSLAADSPSLITDVLPGRYPDWKKLNKTESESEIALGIQVNDTADWGTCIAGTDPIYAKTVQTVGVQDIGVLNPLTSGSFEFTCFHGNAFSQTKAFKYSITFIFELY